MRRLTIALSVLLTGSLVYCDDPTGVLGALGFGVVEGREQTVSADEASLDPVRAKVWRDASGQAFIGVSPLYAQQGVTGVPNAVVCVGENPIEGDPIIPHSRCTMSDSEGNASFHLTHPKRAGVHRTGIVAEVDGEALTPDTVTAEVLAGVAAAHSFNGQDGGPEVAYTGSAVTDAHGNPVPWMFAVDCCATVEGSFDDWPNAARRMRPDTVGLGSFHVLVEGGDTLLTGEIEVEEPEPGVLRIRATFP